MPRSGTTKFNIANCETTNTHSGNRRLCLSQATQSVPLVRCKCKSCWICVCALTVLLGDESPTMQKLKLNKRSTKINNHQEENSTLKRFNFRLRITYFFLLAARLLLLLYYHEVHFAMVATSAAISNRRDHSVPLR